MQQKNHSLDIGNESRMAVHRFQSAVKRLFLGPWFLAFLASLFGVIGLIILSFFTQIKNVTIPFEGVIDAMSQFAPWNKLALLNMISALAVAILTCGGFVMILINMSTNRFGSRCKFGFYMIKMPMFLQNILTLLTVTLTTTKIVRDLVGLIGTTEQYMFFRGDCTEFIIGAIILVILEALYMAYLSYKVLMTVSVMKEAVCSETPIIKQYLFTTIGCCLFAAAGIAVQIWFGFNLTMAMGCASAVLFGVFCVAFRGTMCQLESEE